MKVSFVIPSYNNFPLVNQLLVDLYEHCQPDEVLVVDDCSNDSAAVDGLKWWSLNYKVKVVRPLENLGFLKASNYGMKLATGGIICTISTDVRVEINLSQLLKDILKENPRRLIGGIVYEETTGWNEFGGKIFPYAEGWLLATGKEQWEELGYFDERYGNSDFEDVHLSTLAISKGYQLYPINSPKIQHLGAQTYGYTEERKARTEKNREIFRSIWIK